jgi:Tol biopolymer transport system component
MSAFILLFLTLTSSSQTKPEKLTVEKIMRDPKWMGTSPSGPQWSADGTTIFFNWNPGKATSDSLYYITTDNKTPLKATVEQKQNLLTANMLVYNKARTAWIYSKDGDIFYKDIKTGKTKRITETTESETNPQFSFGEARIVYYRSQNLYAWNILTGETQQLTNLKSGNASSATVPATGTGSSNSPAKLSTESGNQQEAWLKRDQLQYFEVLRSRKEKKELGDAYTKDTKKKELRSISIDDKILQGLNISPDGRFISYSLTKPAIGNKPLLFQVM